MLNRTQRRQQARQERRDNKPVVDGLNAAQLKEAEAELDEGSVSHESSRATTMSALAHSWFALDHQREGSRMTYERIKELRKSGRDLKTDAIVQQYAEAKQEILILEGQVISLLGLVADEDGDEAALALMATTHMNMMNGLGVRFPVPIRTRFAMEAGLSDAVTEGTTEESESRDPGPTDPGDPPAPSTEGTPDDDRNPEPQGEDTPKASERPVHPAPPDSG